MTKGLNQREYITSIYQPLLGKGLAQTHFDELVDLTDHAVSEAVKALGRVADSASHPMLTVQITVAAARLAAERLNWIADRADELGKLAISSATVEEMEAIITNAPNIGAKA